MLKAYKYELRPSIEQKSQLNQAIGACRFVYNLALETKISAYQSGKNYSCFDLINQLVSLKKELNWLNDVPSQSWTCSHCNAIHDRDILAAENIKKFGLRTPPNKRQREAIACA